MGKHDKLRKYYLSMPSLKKYTNLPLVLNGYVCLDIYASCTTCPQRTKRSVLILDYYFLELRPVHFHTDIWSVESQKVVINIQRCSVDNQKGGIAVQGHCDSALLVLNGTSLNSDNALLVLSRLYISVSVARNSLQFSQNFYSCREVEPGLFQF